MSILTAISRGCRGTMVDGTVRLSIKKFCKKCNSETDHHKAGKCKVCDRAFSAKWAAANPDKRKAAAARYRAADPDKVRKSNAKWKAAYPEKVKEINAAWRAKNPEACRIHVQNRNARKRENGGKLSTGLAEKLYKLQRGKCPCCKQPLGDDYHLDHIVPLALGGVHEDWNMQLLRAVCNMQKHKKHPVRFMQSRGFLL